MQECFRARQVGQHSGSRCQQLTQQSQGESGVWAGPVPVVTSLFAGVSAGTATGAGWHGGQPWQGCPILLGAVLLLIPVPPCRSLPVPVLNSCWMDSSQALLSQGTRSGRYNEPISLLGCCLSCRHCPACSGLGGTSGTRQELHPNTSAGRTWLLSLCSFRNAR